MTPKEKAGELYFKYHNLWINGNSIIAKQSALIAVDEILYLLNEIDSTEQWNASYFYNQVKKEIEKL